MERKLRTRVETIDPKLLLIRLLPWLFLLLLYLTASTIGVSANNGPLQPGVD